MYLIFDTETTGLPKRWDAPITDTGNWPRCVQIAWQLHDDMGKLIEHQDYLIKPEGFNIPYDAESVHGISTELAEADGLLMAEVLEKFNIALSKSKFIGYTVPMRLIILLHEFAHKYLNPKIDKPINYETGADIQALYIYLGKGWSPFEAHKSFLYVFRTASSEENHKRYKIINDFISKYDRGEISDVKK